jgi:hypothetical protein
MVHARARPRLRRTGVELRSRLPRGEREALRDFDRRRRLCFRLCDLPSSHSSVHGCEEQSPVPRSRS